MHDGCTALFSLCSGGLVSAQEQVDEGGDVGDGYTAVTVHVGSDGGGDFVAAQEQVDESRQADLYPWGCFAAVCWDGFLWR